MQPAVAKIYIALRSQNKSPPVLLRLDQRQRWGYIDEHTACPQKAPCRKKAVSGGPHHRRPL